MARHGVAITKGDRKAVNAFLKGRRDDLRLSLDALVAELVSKYKGATERGVLGLLWKAIDKGKARLDDGIVVRVPRHA